MRLFLIGPFFRTFQTEFRILEDGRCNICHAYQATFDRSRLQSELNRLLEARGVGDFDALLAFSGGKDSLSTLYTAKVTLGLRVHAVLFDNGFIPKPVLDQAQARCDELDVPLHMARATSPRQDEFIKSVQGIGVDDPSPCYACSSMLNDALTAKALELKVKWIILGTNFFATWVDQPTSVSSHTDREITRINLPYALQMTREQMRTNIAAMGAQIFELKGLSSNCAVPELVQNRVGKVLGHAPEREILSLEVMVGHLERDAALEELAQNN